MGISIVPAQAVPEVFAERLEARQPGETASIATMSVSFDHNPAVESLVNNGLPGDVFMSDSVWHVHGSTFGLLGRSGMEDRAKHRTEREKFEELFPGSYLTTEPNNRGARALFDRSHIKAYRVGNWALSFGGVNCVGSSYEFIDLMLAFESDGFASFMDKFIENRGNLRDSAEAGERFFLDDQSEALIDYGKRGESIIMDSLLTDLDEGTSSVRTSSSYIPQGRLDKKLSQHEADGSEIIFYTNDLNKWNQPTTSPFEKIFNRFNAIRARTHWIDNRSDKFTHLKSVVITRADGTKVAYLLTNTMTDLPVRAGTAEIALRTTDPELVGGIEAFMIDNLGPDVSPDAEKVRN